MRHLTRDFLTAASASCPGTNMYVLSLFLIGCGGYAVVGQTNFDIMSTTLRVSSGTSASINTVGGPHDVSLPQSMHAVSSADVGRILVMRSERNPRWNSGLFRVTGYDATLNTLSIDYRASADAPQEESIPWALYVDEVTASTFWRSGSNGTQGYGSWDPSSFVTASASRIVLRSPSDTAWQVRMCLESLLDVSGNVPCGFSVAPGFGGISNGDFVSQLGGSARGHDQRLFLHTALYHNSRSPEYLGTVVGLTPSLSMGQWRLSMIVDDLTGTCGMVNRNVSLPNPPTGSGWMLFGMCEDESDVPTGMNISDPTLNCPRLVAVAPSNQQPVMTWDSQFHVDNRMQVVGFSTRGFPVPGVLSCYSDCSNPGNTHVRYLTSSAASAWSGATELLDVEVLIGMIDQAVSATAQPVFPMHPRRLGRLPFFMQCRANEQQWSVLDVESGSYYHTSDGVCIAWGGPPPTDAATGSIAREIMSSIADGSGIASHGVSLPGSDPTSQGLTGMTNVIDETRYRKTYSYSRQQPLFVDVIKGG